MNDLPEITEVQRLTLRPGDSLVLRVPQNLSPDVADRLKERLRETLGLDLSTKIVVLDSGMSLEVAERAPLDAREISRALDTDARRHPGRSRA